MSHQFQYFQNPLCDLNSLCFNCGLYGPMSYSSAGTSSRNNGMEGDVVSSRPIECICNFPIKKNIMVSLVCFLHLCSLLMYLKQLRPYVWYMCLQYIYTSKLHILLLIFSHFFITAKLYLPKVNRSSGAVIDMWIKVLALALAFAPPTPTPSLSLCVLL
jgi:hypothetical protein